MSWWEEVPFAEPEAGRIRLTVTRDQRTGCVAMGLPAARAGPQLIQEILEPFPAIGNGHGVSLAIPAPADDRR